MFFNKFFKHFSFHIVAQTADVLNEAVVRYQKLVFPDSGKGVATNLDAITSLEIHVQDEYKPLDLTSDESCKYLHPNI